MIIKNPYKVLVKNYRIINLLLIIPTVYLLFKFTGLATFFEQYVFANYYTPEKDLVDIYIPAIAMVLPVVTAIIHIIVWIILALKKKKNYYHLISAGYQLFLFLALVFFYTSLLNIEMGNVDNTFANFLRDISDLIVYPIYILILMGAINVVGFNIKSLRFDKHEDLKLTEEDEEDIEVKVGTDNNDTKRRFVHAIRELKYYVVENKLIIALVILVLVCLVGFKAFLNYQVYNKTYYLNQSFVLDNFALSVKESYITPLDYSGRVITKNKYYLAVKIGIHNQGMETKIDRSVFRIFIGENELLPIYEKSSRFLDIGSPYQGEIIKPDEAKDYVFVYELTEKQLKNTYEMRILNGLNVDGDELLASYKKINIRPEYLANLEKKSTKKIKETLKLTDTTLEGTTYKLNKVNIQPSYVYEYEICSTPKRCNTIQDTIVPSGGKTLMIIEDEINYNTSTAYYSYLEKNFYEDFVTVEYTFDIRSGANAGPCNQIASIKDVTPTHIKDKKIFEVPSNMQSAYKINFIFTIRNKVHTIKVLE